MANRLENEVGYFLRPTENVTIALEALIVRGDLQDGVVQRRESTGEEVVVKNKRILAVVIHKGSQQEGRYVPPSTAHR